MTRWWLVLVLACGCGGSSSSPDASVGDGGFDGATVNAAHDGGQADATGPVDASFLDAATAAEKCLAAGGTVAQQLCCASTSDFPNLCAVGACGCAPASSHQINVCRCAGTACWDGTRCTP